MQLGYTIGVDDCLELKTHNTLFRVCHVTMYKLRLLTDSLLYKLFESLWLNRNVGNCYTCICSIKYLKLTWYTLADVS